MKKLIYPILLGLFGISCALASSASQTAKSSAPNSAPPSTQKSASPDDQGERAFRANCSRCHYAPDTLNPRITGTVIRHMRVRANLSAADERAILHYLNP
ncbi:cytochrome c5 [Granulicella aggregans]|uniref:Cytochrome c5 n=1 Tax=Granulicella aggregans TaxID=474949 RepID=A0A7W8E534_9BACT|nr:cytochrome c [Granulicella aggregans]MBB5059673.1 cytochrome c5 [Granulicella aggregans]